MGKSSKQTTKSEEKTAYPEWQQAGLQNAANTGANLASSFLQSPAFANAGFSTDQLKAFDLARQSAMGAYLNGGVGIPQSMGYTPSTYSAEGYAPTSAIAAQMTGSDITNAMNPYLSDVVDQVRKSGQRDLAETQAAIGARAAAAGSFGGSREAIQRGMADKNAAESMNSTVAQLMASGYDKATAIAQANASLRQQTGLANAEAANQAGQFNSSIRNAANEYGANAGNQAAQFGLSNAQSYAQLQDALKSNDLNRQMTALQSLLATGSAQQEFAQTALNTPFEMLQRYASLVPQQLNSESSGTQTTKGGGSSPLGQLLGLGLSVGGMGVSGGGSLLGNFLSKKFS